MTNGIRDLLFGWRMLARNKGFTTVAILALALGIGPNVAIFSIIYATFLAPLPYAHPEQLVVAWTKVKGERVPSRANEYLQILSQSKSFQRLDYEPFTGEHLTGEDHEQEEIGGQRITPGLYSQTLGLRIALGRDLQPGDAVSGNEHVTVLTHRLWQDRFHSDPGILGKAIRIDDKPYTIVGVLAPGVADRIPTTHFFVPAVLTPGGENPFWGFIIGRLKPGVTLLQAQAELSTINAHIVRPTSPGVSPAEVTLGVDPLKNDWLDKKLERNLWLLLAAVCFVLLIACANLANLLLARGASRQRELAVRSALGATRAEIFAQLLVESLALAIPGGAIGIALGWALIKVIMAILPDLANQSAEAVVQLNIPVLVFGVVVSLLAGVLAGCAPAWHATRLNLSEILKQNARTSGGSRLRTQRILIISEFALALTLLAGAALTLHSFWNLAHVDLGVRTDHILTGYMSGPRVSELDPVKTAATAHVLLSRLDALPGVYGAALASSMPIDGHGSYPFTLAGQPVNRQGRPVADLEVASPTFFDTLGVRLLRGRFFGETDRLTSPPVAMVNEIFARHFLAGRNPLNERLLLDRFGSDEKSGPPVTWQIIGVFHDVRNGDHLAEDSVPQILLPYWQIPSPYIGLVVRTALDPVLATRDVRLTLRQVMPGVTLQDVQSLQQRVEKQLTGDRFSVILFGAFALLALGLAALGIYGVIAFAVAQRGPEIGLRIALGARQSDMLLMVLGDAAKMSLYGIGFGLIGVLTVGHLLRSTLFGIGTVDLGGFLLVALLLTAVAVIASFGPARRSSRIDPMVALREE